MRPESSSTFDEHHELILDSERPPNATRGEATSANGDGTGSAPWSIERRLIRRLLSWCGNPKICVTLWDGTACNQCDDDDAPRLHIRDRATLWRLIGDPEYWFSELYVQKRIEVTGTLEELMCRVNRALRDSSVGRRFPSQWQRNVAARTVRVSRENVRHHYDLGNSFYRLWLDDQMLYTCAYYRSEANSLEQAQIDKMDHICRKLRLQPGEEVIEAGCGWGGFALHMAREYGVTVKAYNVSTEQLSYARRRTEEEGLTGQVEFIEDDWRNIAGACDAFVSVGMLEHVGVRNYSKLGKVIERVLRPHGRGLIHTIGQNQEMPLNRWIERRIFPGAEPPTLRQMMDIFSPFDLTVTDVENLRPHYARTCRDWLDRFESAADQIREMFDEQFVRMWRMYLASSISAFETNRLQLYQVLFMPGGDENMPATRQYMYPSDQHSLHGNGH